MPLLSIGMPPQPYRSVGMVVFVLAVAFIGVFKLWIVDYDDEQKRNFGGWRVAGIHANNSTFTDNLYVIFHVGPAKMGSTSIQIQGLQKYEQELHQDGYNVVDFRDASQLNQCLVRDTVKCQSQPDQEWSRFVKFLQESKRHKRHVVFSTENHWNFFSNNTLLVFSAYQQVFSQFGYHVRIVIGYRPLFDYWPSIYFQKYNHYCGYSHQDVGTIPSLVDFWKHTNKTKQLRHPSYAALQHAQHYFTNVYILPLGDEFVERFLCHTMVHATHACRAIIHSQDEEAPILNHKHSLFSDRLAQAAKSHNVSSKSCKKLSQRIQQHLVNGPLLQEKLPRTCLDDSQQEWLWNKTLFYHHEIVDANSTVSVSDVELRRDFENGLHATLCEVNVEQALVDFPELFRGGRKTNATTSSHRPP